ncbi:MAG: pantetheine-phosphate adenylyltransferase [Elusimicrobiales bacterium]|nr:pantetheine-phosphate adenylyltransferase [Elusimicrobiales bacterium]
MKKIKSALYPGSFDPLTFGHLDIIERACQIFDKLIVSIFVNQSKKPLFTLEERVDILKKVLGKNKSIIIDCFDGLLVDYMKRKKIKVIIRGLRAVSDLEYEFQYAAANRTLDPEIETIFFMPRLRYSYLSSSVVREILKFGGDVSKMVPPYVIEVVKRKNNNKI